MDAGGSRRTMRYIYYAVWLSSREKTLAKNSIPTDLVYIVDMYVLAVTIS